MRCCCCCGHCCRYYCIHFVSSSFSLHYSMTFSLFDRCRYLLPSLFAFDIGSNLVAVHLIIVQFSTQFCIFSWKQNLISCRRIYRQQIYKISIEVHCNLSGLEDDSSIASTFASDSNLQQRTIHRQLHWHSECDSVQIKFFPSDSEQFSSINYSGFLDNNRLQPEVRTWHSASGNVGSKRFIAENSFYRARCLPNLIDYINADFVKWSKCEHVTNCHIVPYSTREFIGRFL